MRIWILIESKPVSMILPKAIGSGNPVAKCLRDIFLGVLTYLQLTIYHVFHLSVILSRVHTPIYTFDCNAICTAAARSFFYISGKSNRIF